MYYLNNICLLCLSYDKNNISQDYHLEVEKELEYILPPHILRISNIPKHVCNECMEILKMFCIFKKKCLNSVTIFNKYIQKLAQASESYQCLSVTLTDILYQNNSKMLNKADDCSFATKYKTDNNDHVEKMTNCGEEDTNGDIITVVEGDKAKFSETTFTVKKGHSYSKNDKFFNQEQIPKLDIDIIKTDSKYECESCELDFTTLKQLNNQTFCCKKKNIPDGVDYFKKNLKGKVLEIDNCENCQPVIQQKENIEQDSLKIEDNLEEVKKEINEEIIIKDEPSDIHNIFECETCELAFGTKMQLISHTSWCKKNKISIETTNQIQNNCTSSNKSESIFSNSKKKLKPCVKPYGCDVCNKAFHLKRTLIKHKRIHTGDKPYECDVCKISFKFPSRLRVHKLIHTGEKPFSCDVCGRSFESKSRLTSHNYTHTGVKKFPCDICRSLFLWKSQLTSHKLIHTGKKPFSCDVCGSSFRIKTQLNHHKLIHADKKSFSCDVCEKKFKQKNCARQHKLTHTAEKAYKCDSCKKSFKLKSYLNKHRCLCH